MAGKKFSEFTTSAMGAATSFLVGYDTVADTNDRWDRTAVAGWLSPALSNLYTTSATIGTTRVAKVTDTLTFQNLAGSNTLFTLNDDGTFTLGLGATATNQHNIAIGNDAEANTTYSMAIGSQTRTPGIQGLAIGYAAGAVSGTANNVINIGTLARGSAGNSITLTSHGSTTSPSTATAFGVYMTSNTVADFEVVGGGESTLNTSLKVTGQSYSELNDIGTVATATWDIDWNDGNIQSITLNNGGAMTLNTPTNPKTGATYILKLIQGASPSTVTWTASIFKWPAATAPTLSTTTAYVDVITLIYDGTNYLGTSTLDLR